MRRRRAVWTRFGLGRHGLTRWAAFGLLVVSLTVAFVDWMLRKSEDTWWSHHEK